MPVQQEGEEAAAFTSDGGDGGGGGGGGVEVVPAGASVWGVGVEMLTRRVEGEDMSPLNKFRWVDSGWVGGQGG